MILRILAGVGLVALGYYVGREIGRTESVREELRKVPPPALSHKGEGEKKNSKERGST